MSPVSPGFPSVKILVVDDNLRMRQIIVSVLRAFGFRSIEEAGSCDEALNSFSVAPPDLVIVDYMMPQRTGLDFLHAVRKTVRQERYVPVIMLSGHSDVARVMEARDAGVTEYLAKPVTPSGLLSRIKATAYHARPFVLGSAYVGPCRRRSNRQPHNSPLRRKDDFLD